MKKGRESWIRRKGRSEIRDSLLQFSTWTFSRTIEDEDERKEGKR